MAAAILALPHRCQRARQSRRRLPQPLRQDRRALLGRRRHRRGGARGRRKARRAARPAGGDREQAGRGRAARHRVRRHAAARRLHPADCRRQRNGDQPADRQDQLRRAQELHPAHHRDRDAADPAGAAEPSGAVGQGPDRLGEEQSRTNRTTRRPRPASRCRPNCSSCAPARRPSRSPSRAPTKARWR